MTAAVVALAEPQKST
uniref:Uncharacterized protein n=1 Tax=Anguilla anguilla TaxID=7936 RepID=A0A0E9UJ50_ANGAN